MSNNDKKHPSSPVLQIMLRKFASDYKADGMVADAMRDAADEIDRLNQWADGMTDAMLKERRLADATIKELRALLEQSATREPMVCYAMCKAHEGMSFTMKCTAIVQSVVAVCPICNPPPK